MSLFLVRLECITNVDKEPKGLAESHGCLLFSP